MFEQGVFTSNFWNWFITLLTLGGIAGLVWLILWMSTGDRPKPGEEVKTMGHVWDGNLEELNNPLPMWWLNMFYITMIFGVIYLVLYPGLGSFAGILEWTEVKQYEQEVASADNRFGKIYDKYKNEPLTTLVDNADAVKIGGRLFSTYCTVCHASDARGAPNFPNLADNDWLYGGEPEAIKTSIMQGRQGMMPSAAQNGLKGEADVKNVTNYVLSLSGLQHDKAAAEQGKGIFTSVCVACHGPEGKGNLMLGAPNLTDEVWLYKQRDESVEESVMKTVEQGRQGKMPAHGEFLGEAKVHLLATYIYSLSQQQ
jgi:cytochrome c oxidase cbb3-type subunit 3